MHVYNLDTGESVWIKRLKSEVSWYYEIINVAQLMLENSMAKSNY